MYIHMYCMYVLFSKHRPVDTPPPVWTYHMDTLECPAPSSQIPSPSSSICPGAHCAQDTKIAQESKTPKDPQCPNMKHPGIYLQYPAHQPSPPTATANR